MVLGVLPASAASSATGATQRFEVTASRYKFEPARIEVRQGEVVELVLRSADTDHGVAIKAYAVKVAIPKGGETVGVSFVANRKYAPRAAATTVRSCRRRTGRCRDCIPT